MYVVENCKNPIISYADLTKYFSTKEMTKETQSLSQILLIYSDI